MKYFKLAIVLMNFLLFAVYTNAGQKSEEAIQYMQSQWEIDNFKLSGTKQKEAFKELIYSAEMYVEQFPNDASVLIWSGIIKSTYAGVKGGLGALKYAKASKVDFERGLQLDPLALKGSGYTSLGTLYANVPGWPISFGSDKKARELFENALKINPNGIESNYFYAEFLYDMKKYDQAKIYYRKALSGDVMLGRELTNINRRKEITEALKILEKHINS